MEKFGVTIELYDKISEPVNKIIESTRGCTKVFENLQRTIENSIDLTTLDNITKMTQSAREAMNGLQWDSNTGIEKLEQGLLSINNIMSMLDERQLELGTDKIREQVANVTNQMTELHEKMVELNNQELALSVDTIELNTDKASRNVENLNQKINSINDVQLRVDTTVPTSQIDDLNQKLASINDVQLRVDTTVPTSQIDDLNQKLASINDVQLRVDTTVPTSQIDDLNQKLASLNNMQLRVDTTVPTSQIDDLNQKLASINDVQLRVDTTVPTSQIDDLNQKLASLNNVQLRVQTNLPDITKQINVLNNQANKIRLVPTSAKNDLSDLGMRIRNIQNALIDLENTTIELKTDETIRQMEDLRDQISLATDNINTFGESANQDYSSIDQNIQTNIASQGQFNDTVEQSINLTHSLESGISKLASAFGMYFSARQVINFAKKSLKAFDTQLNTETQLMTVLANSLNEDYSISLTTNTSSVIDNINAIQNNLEPITVDANIRTQALEAEFEKITSKAQDIQARGMFGDEVLISGAAELSTYFTDTDAIEMMMDTLADYAAGMSLGEEVNAKAMSDYATNLGKIMGGAYDSMTKKGFTFTDAQKAVIEGTASQAEYIQVLGEDYVDLTEDMRAATAITQVIGDSWSGMYETMSDTPHGKIVQLGNAWGDLTETIGQKLYPSVIAIIDTINDNWSTIESIINAVASGIEFILQLINGVLQIIINVADFIKEHWSFIGPLIMGVVSAITMLKIITTLQTVATKLWAGAQTILNATLLGCPIVWIALAIIGIIALIYIIIARINKLKGTAISATGVIFGAISAAGAAVWNVFLGVLDFVLGIISILVNSWISFANFFSNLFNDPIATIIHLFGDFANRILNIINTIARGLDAIFGSNLSAAVEGWKSTLNTKIEAAANKYGNGSYEEVMEKIDLNVETLGLKRLNYGNAYISGYDFGANIENGIGETLESLNPNNFLNKAGLNSYDEETIPANIADTAGNTARTADALNITDEDLKYLRDIAERDVINRFTTAEIKVDMGGITNNVNSEVDLDGIVDYLANGIQEAMEKTAQGVHA